MSEKVRIAPQAPRSRSYLVEVEHHGRYSGAIVKGKKASDAAGAMMLGHLRAQCATTGPADSPNFDAVAAVDGVSQCPSGADQ